jgi:hypothetical protein
MHFERRKGLGTPDFSDLFSTFPGKKSSFLLITLFGLVLRSLAQDVQVPDYFSSPPTQDQTPNQSEIRQHLTESDAESVLNRAEDALQKLAAGDNSAADLFASIFGESVDYYDEGRKTPRQIALDKATIFRNYRSYFTRRVGNLVLSDTESPDVKWVSFSYRYEVLKRSGGVLRGLADARWALQEVGGKILVIATRETIHRQ